MGRRGEEKKLKHWGKDENNNLSKNLNYSGGREKQGEGRNCMVLCSLVAQKEVKMDNEKRG